MGRGPGRVTDFLQPVRMGFKAGGASGDPEPGKPFHPAYKCGLSVSPTSLSLRGHLSSFLVTVVYMPLRNPICP